MDPFEEQREANIARNRKMLQDMGIEVIKNEIVMSRPKQVPKTKLKVQKKRKQVDSVAESDEEESKPGKKPRKTAFVENVDTPPDGLRRSGRNAGKKIDYRGDGDFLKRNDGPHVISENARNYELSEARSPLERKHDP